jgi:hypothetical protein
MEQVIRHNEGELRGCDSRDNGVYLTIGKAVPTDSVIVKQVTVKVMV